LLGFYIVLTALYINYLSLEECLTLRHQMIRRFFLTLLLFFFFFLFAAAERATTSQKVKLADGMYFVEKKKSMSI